MIRIFTLLALSLFSFSVIAGERPKGSSLVISSFDNSALRVTIDGRTFNARDNYFAISNVRQGYHTIQIYRSMGSRGIIDIFGRNREQLVFNERVFIKKNTEVEISITRNGRAQIHERRLRGRDSRDYRDWDDKSWNDRNDRDDRYDRDRDRRDDRNGRYGNDGYGSNDPSVSFPELQQMKETLRRESYENTRMGIARQMFDANYFKAEQVRELLQMFSFENYRLDLAKYAYRNTSDKHNYYLVNDVFSYSRSKQELARFISQYR